VNYIVEFLERKLQQLSASGFRSNRNLAFVTKISVSCARADFLPEQLEFHGSVLQVTLAKVVAARSTLSFATSVVD